MKLWRIVQASCWIAVYLVLTLAPVFILLVGPQRPPGRDFWREFSVAIGFSGLAMLALQFVLTARFKVVKAPYGSDVVYYFHRQISLVAFALVLMHPLILFISSPATLGLLNVFTAPWRARAGVVALLALIVLIGISLWRRRLRLDYTPWRIWHGVLATVVVALALVHVTLVGYYVNVLWKRELWLGYGAFWVLLLAYRRVFKPLLLLRRSYVVTRVTPERGDAWSLTFQPIGHSGLRFHPGQFAWLTLHHSPYAETEHPFSFSSSAQEFGYLTVTIKALGDFTRTIKDVPLGQRAYLDGPFGAFSCDRHPHALGYVFIAGGIGITPVMSMLRTLASRGERRPLLLIYANKNWDGVTFREDLDDLLPRLNLRVVHVLSDPPPGWTGEVGRVTPELLTRYLPLWRQRDAYEVFLCGPQPMMDAVERALVHLGVPLGDIHTERFNLV